MIHRGEQIFEEQGNYFFLQKDKPLKLNITRNSDVSILAGKIICTFLSFERVKKKKYKICYPRKPEKNEKIQFSLNFLPQKFLGESEKGRYSETAYGGGGASPSWKTGGTSPLKN